MSHPAIRQDNRQQFRDEALCRSVFYGLLSQALHYPTPEIFGEIRSEKASQALRQAAGWLVASRLPEERKAPFAEQTPIDLVARVEDWLGTFAPLTLDGLLAARGRLFGHTAQGLVCPYEAEYGQEGLFQQPRQLARIEGFYRAFGLMTRSAERERPDHVSCELEFLDFLSRKEAFVLESGDEATLEETRKAIRLFLRDHLGRFGRSFGRLLREHDPRGFFGRLGDLLFEFVTFECGRLEIQPGPPLLSLRPADPDSVPMACGGESELVQLQTPSSFQTPKP